MKRFIVKQPFRKYNKRIVFSVIVLVLAFGNYFYQTFITTKSQDNTTPPLTIYIEPEYRDFFNPLLEEYKKQNQAEFLITEKKTEANYFIAPQPVGNPDYKTQLIIEVKEAVKPRQFILLFSGKESLSLWASWQNSFLLGEEITQYIISKTVTNTLIFGGDVMLSRAVGQKMKQSENYVLPIEQIKDFISKADYRIANLESPFLDGEMVFRKDNVFKTDPQAIESIKIFDLVSLANNHFGDQGQDGVRFTIDHLSKNDIAFIGGGKDANQAYAGYIKEFADQKIGFLSYTDTDVIPASYHATGEQGGVAVMNIEQLNKDIERMKKETPNIIVLMHSGTEYKTEPNSRQREFAHSAVDAGAKLVIGNHPHVVQGIEEYKGIPIIYSLGNLVFDQPWSPETTQGLLIKATYGLGRSLSLEFYPIKIDNNYSPRVLAENDTEALTILDRIYTASLGLRQF